MPVGGTAGRRPDTGVRRRDIHRGGKQAHGGKRRRQSQEGRTPNINGIGGGTPAVPAKPQVGDHRCLKNMHLRLLDNAGVRCIVEAT
jgi:hypothetical protein